MLDNSTHEVFNLGLGSRTMMKNGDRPYWNEIQYRDSLSSEADIILLMLGTNDAKTYQWNQDDFVSDYKEMLGELVNSTKAKIYLMIPPPLYGKVPFKVNQTVVNEILPVLIPQIAMDMKVDGLVDIFGALGGHELTMPEIFEDYCHPNDEGYVLIAKTIFKEVFETRKAIEENQSTIIDILLILFAVYIVWKLIDIVCCKSQKQRHH